MIIKLNAIDSTNAFLKRLIHEKSLLDYTAVVAQKQTGGRGQMGTYWQTEPYKNLIMSVFKRVSCLKGEAQFLLSMAVSIAVVRTLENFKIPDIQIKWPNDILSANKKICGILIETVIKEGTMDIAIIGIGLNINQIIFPGLEQATSMQKQVDHEYEIDLVRDHLITQCKHIGQMLESESTRFQLKEIYLGYLFRLYKPSTFEDPQGNRFMGIIQGVSENGKLKVRLENEIVHNYNIKEIKLLF